MTHILNESAWWLFVTTLNGPAWFILSCMILGLWASYDAARRHL